MAADRLEQLVDVADQAPGTDARPETGEAREAELGRDAREGGRRVERPVRGLHEPAVALAVRVPPQGGAAAAVPGDVLRLHHLAQAKEAVGAADPAVLDPAPGSAGLTVARDAVVDRHHPRGEPLLEAAPRLRAPRPPTGGQAVLAVVGQEDRLPQGIPPHDRRP